MGVASKAMCCVCSGRFLPFPPPSGFSRPGPRRVPVDGAQTANRLAAAVVGGIGTDGRQPFAPPECSIDVVSDGSTTTEALVSSDALHIAFDRHAGALLRLCILLTGRRQEAEDLVQDSFVRLAPKAGALGEDITWPYLRRIALNLWKNRLRRIAIEARARRRGDLDAPIATSPPEDRDQM